MKYFKDGKKIKVNDKEGENFKMNCKKKDGWKKKNV